MLSSANLPLKWQMNAVTRTGTTVKRFQTEVILVILGRNLGIAIFPFSDLIIVIPAVIAKKMNASATAKADVYLNESASTESMSHSKK
jgi:hypothetical protein